MHSDYLRHPIIASILDADEYVLPNLHVLMTANATHPSVSIVIPLYNEVERFSAIEPAIRDFDAGWTGDYEVIMVDDGSTDQTWASMQKLKQRWDQSDGQILIYHQENAGKGMALTHGIRQATKDWILTLDADMAAEPSNLVSWLDLVHRFQTDCIYIGSRAHESTTLKAKWIRKVSGMVFRRLTQLILNTGIKDTQCGFKFYPRSVASHIFNQLSCYGWAHDIEVLYRLKELGYQLKEMPLIWSHVDGSKISLVKDGLNMIIEVIAIRRAIKIKATTPLSSNH